jgi:S1-C subfamily serine protease
VKRILKAAWSFLNAKLPSTLSIALIVGGMCWASHDTWGPLLPNTQDIVVERTLWEDLVSGTVLIQDSNKRGGASGVMIKRDGKWYCWTADHVVDALEQAGGLTSAHLTARVFKQGAVDDRVYCKIKKVVARDEGMDLAFLELIIPDREYFSPRLGPKTLRLGQTVYHCGNIYAETVPWCVSQGRVIQMPGESYSPTRYLDQGSFIIANITGYPGCSGGGLFDKQRRLVGILSGAFGPGVLVIITRETMVKFAFKHKVPWIL